MPPGGFEPGRATEGSCNQQTHTHTPTWPRLFAYADSPTGPGKEGIQISKSVAPTASTGDPEPPTQAATGADSGHSAVLGGLAIVASPASLASGEPALAWLTAGSKNSQRHRRSMVRTHRGPESAKNPTATTDRRNRCFLVHYVCCRTHSNAGRAGGGLLHDYMITDTDTAL